MTAPELYYFVKRKQVVTGPYTVMQLVGMLKKGWLTLQSPVSADKVQWESLLELFRRRGIDVSWFHPVPGEELPQEKILPHAVPPDPEAPLLTAVPEEGPRPVVLQPAPPESAASAVSVSLAERLCRLIWDPASDAVREGEEKKAWLFCLLYGFNAALLTGALRSAGTHSLLVFGFALLHRMGSVVLAAVLAILTVRIVQLLAASPEKERRRRFLNDALALFLPLVTFFLTCGALLPKLFPPPELHMLPGAACVLVMFTYLSIVTGSFFRNRFPGSNVLLSWGNVYFILAANAVHYTYMFFIKEF